MASNVPRRVVPLAAEASVAARACSTLVTSTRGIPVNRASSNRYGPGGRMSVSGKTVTIFGGTGFLGRYLANRMGGMGTACIFPYRGTEWEARHLRVAADYGRFAFVPFSGRDRDSIRTAVKQSDIVVNLIGKTYETKHYVPWLVNYSFEDVNVDIARTIAEVCAEEGVSRLVHFSALSADPDSPSPWCRTKALGELAVREAFPEATVVRPATMFGQEDQLLNTFVKWIRFMGRTLVVDGGARKLQPVWVEDVAEAVAVVSNDDYYKRKTLELAGPDVLTMKEVSEFVFAVLREEPRMMDLPYPVAMALAKINNLMPNPWLVPDWVARQTIDDVRSPASRAIGFEEIGLKPVTLEDVAFNYLYFRRRGSHFATED